MILLVDVVAFTCDRIDLTEEPFEHENVSYACPAIKTADGTLIPERSILRSRTREKLNLSSRRDVSAGVRFASDAGGADTRGQDQDPVNDWKHGKSSRDTKGSRNAWRSDLASRLLDGDGTPKQAKSLEFLLATANALRKARELEEDVAKSLGKSARVRYPIVWTKTHAFFHRSRI